MNPINSKVSDAELSAAVATTLVWLDARADYYDAEAVRFMCVVLAGRAEDCRTTGKLLRRHLGFAGLLKAHAVPVVDAAASGGGGE